MKMKVKIKWDNVSQQTNLAVKVSSRVATTRPRGNPENDEARIEVFLPSLPARDWGVGGSLLAREREVCSVWLLFLPRFVSATVACSFFKTIVPAWLPC